LRIAWIVHIREYGAARLPILVAIVVATLITIFVTVLIMHEAHTDQVVVAGRGRTGQAET